MTKAKTVKFSGLEYVVIDEAFNGVFGSDLIYISSLKLPNKILDACIEFAFTNKNARVITSASRTLSEVGFFDAKYKLTPVQILHKTGLLTNRAIAGGVYLDKDDLKLIKQENASVYLTPTFDIGGGHGIPPLKNYLNAGIKLKIESMGGEFNPNFDLQKEAEILYFAVNGSLCKKDAVTKREIQQIIENE